MATRQLTNRRIAPVLGAGNTRVEARKLAPSTPVAPAHHSNLRLLLQPWKISLPPPCT
jgi:hypothetical protein